MIGFEPTTDVCQPAVAAASLKRTQRRGAESPALLPQPPESVLRRTAVGTHSSSQRDLDRCRYLGRPSVATLGLSCTPNRQLGHKRKSLLQACKKSNEVCSRAFCRGSNPVNPRPVRHMDSQTAVGQ